MTSYDTNVANVTKSIKHTCDPVERAFGRRANNCQRCLALISGVPARTEQAA
jgi:hypothetical protein